MSRTLKRISAGSIELVSLTTRGSRYDAPKTRAEKQKASSEAQRRMNAIYSRQKLELILAANFPTAGSGLVVTLTYDDRHMPKTRKQAMKRWNDFLGDLRKARRDAGLPELVAVSCVEVLTSEGGRWHHHAVINNTGHDLDMIRACWRGGSDIEARKLRVDAEKNHESLARYMTKEARELLDYDSKPGQRGWTCTRNAKRPERDTVTVPDDYEIVIPAEATVLLDEHRTTEWASWHVVKLRYDGAGRAARAPRARRRRRRRE